MRTALDRYALLEARGEYFDGRTARPVETVVKFGEATLMLLRPDGVPFAHWALASLRALPETGRGTLVLLPDSAGEERLTLSDPDMVAAIRSVCPDLLRRPRRRGDLPRLLVWAGGAVGAVALIYFVLLPAIAGRLAVLIPPAREEAMGRAVIAQIEGMLGGIGSAAPRTCDNAEGLTALDRMVARVEKHAGSHVPLRVRVLDHPMVNAFAVPGGHIVLFRGLIEAAESPEEVAGVLAHEVGHVVARDPTRLALRAAGSAGVLGLLIGDVAGGAFVVILAEQLVSAAYTRDAERAADAAAHRIMVAAELPLAPLARFFDRLAARNGRPTGALTHLATHPDLLARALATRDADRIGPGRFIPVLDDQDWVALRGICDR